VSREEIINKEDYHRLRITCCGYCAVLLPACHRDCGSGLDQLGEVEDWAAGRVSVPDPGGHAAGQEAGT